MFQTTNETTYGMYDICILNYWSPVFSRTVPVGPDCMPRDTGRGTRLEASSSPETTTFDEQVHGENHGKTIGKP